MAMGGIGRILVVICALVLFLFSGILTSSNYLKETHSQLNIIVETGLIATANTSAAATSDYAPIEKEEESCFRPRNNTDLPHYNPITHLNPYHQLHYEQYGHLPKPYINLGMPKMGSTSLQYFLKCGGVKSSHWQCGQKKNVKVKGAHLCAGCMRNVMKYNVYDANADPTVIGAYNASLLYKCGDFDAYMQLDDGSFFPQIEYLDHIHAESPNATFIFTFRDMAGWYRSLSHWPPKAKLGSPKIMAERLKQANITGFPQFIEDGVRESEETDKEERAATKEAKEVKYFSEWFCKRVEFVRDFVKKYPSHALIEIDILDPNVNAMMEKVFNISKNCWAHTNKNPNLLESENETFSDEAEDEIDTIDKTDDFSVTEVADKSEETKGVDFSLSCFKARNNTISPSQRGNLPKPYLNLGFPKMGSTSLHKFFQCGHVNSSHYICGNPDLCATCMQNVIKKSGNSLQSPQLLSSCGNYDAYMQMDHGSFFPQIEYLSYIHMESPNATFLMPFRPMQDWYRSITHWPPKAELGSPKILAERLRKANITSFPSGRGVNLEEFSEWYCKRVEYVREFVRVYPSHALVEVDILDPNVGVFLGNLFGINDKCWKQVNKNKKLEEN